MKKIRLEQILYLLAFLLALVIRLLDLGKAPLSEFEAGWALQSLALARGGSVALGAQPGYIFPTVVLFNLLKATNFAARFWPALAGSLLLLAPYAFRDRLGQKAALIVAFGLALDPGMVALSRLAGGPMLAISFAVLACALLYARKYALGGVAAGLALLSGPTVLLGLLGFAIAYGLSRLLGFFRDDDILPDEDPSEIPEQTSTGDWRVALLFGGGTILIIGTLFFLFPKGLGSWAATLTVFLKGWALPSNIPAGRLFAAFVFYDVLAFVFGLISAVRGWAQGQKLAQFLSLWLLAALLLPLFYAGRQVSDVAWALLPLWALTGLEIARYTRRREHWLVSLGQAAVVVVLMAVIWLTLSGLDVAAPESVLNYWFVIGAAILIMVLVGVLVYLGWRWQTARDGLVWGLVVGLGVFSLASTFWVSLVRPSTPLELWVPTPTILHADLFAATIEDIAISQTGNANFLEVVSLVDEPSVRWVLRNTEGAVFATALGEGENPLVVITRESQPVGARGDFYRGQDFGWWETPGWGEALPWEPLKWLINREGAVNVEKVVLWARVDLFPEQQIVEENLDFIENTEEELSPPVPEGDADGE